MVQVPPGGRIRREVDLEASVEQESVTFVRADAAPDAVGRLEERNLRTAFSQYFCTRKAGKTGPDNYNFHKFVEFNVSSPRRLREIAHHTSVTLYFFRDADEIELITVAEWGPGRFRGGIYAIVSGSSGRKIAGRAPRITVALIVFVVFVVLTLVARRALKTALVRTTMAPRIRILVIRMVTISTLVVGGLIFLVVVTEASLGRVITGFGLLSVGVGLALKSPLENMISGILTILVAPFRIGDEIEVSGYAGRVEDVSIHDTIIRTFDGKRVAIPNVDVYLNPVTNQTAYPIRRFDVLVGIHYNDDLPKAVGIAHRTLDETEGVRKTPEPQVLVTTLNEFSVDMILRFWSDPSMHERVQDDLRRNHRRKTRLRPGRHHDTVPDPNPPHPRRRRKREPESYRSA